MKERLRTLVIDSNGSGWKAILADTTLRGLLGLRGDAHIPPRLRRLPLAARLFGERYAATGYMGDWREALREAPELDVKLCNIANLIEYARNRRAMATYPLVIILHSAAGDDMSLLLKTAGWFTDRRGTLVMFIGNEYDLMPEKRAFIRAADVDYVCTQLPIESARWLYADCVRACVLAMPHALNPKVYRPDPMVKRTIDVGFIGTLYPPFIGDMERTHVIRFFEQFGAEYGLCCEIRTAPGARIPREVWARFLNACKTIVGGESGTYYLSRDRSLVDDAKRYMQRHPDASFGEVFNRFFKHAAGTFSGKAISSRHFEPIGTKTCQVLLKGHYNGILHADEHYIAVERDLSNMSEVIERLKDDSYRSALSERTYDYAMAAHTYRHRIQSLIAEVAV